MIYIHRNIPDTLDLLHFAYHQNQFMEDAINTTIHTALSLSHTSREQAQPGETVIY